MTKKPPRAADAAAPDALPVEQPAAQATTAAEPAAAPAMPADVPADVPPAEPDLEPASQPELQPLDDVQTPAPSLARAVATYAFGPAAVGQIVEAPQDVIDAHAAQGNVDAHPDAVAHAEAVGALTIRL